MNYHCGHKGCDICGARVCKGTTLRKFGIYEVCDSCLQHAVWLAVTCAETFGGAVIDPAKPCGNKGAREHENRDCEG
jgi:hypothetical protein